jgi:hypothetical protein
LQILSKVSPVLSLYELIKIPKINKKSLLDKKFYELFRQSIYIILGCVLTKQLRLLSKQMEKGNSVVLRYNSFTNETAAKSIENMIGSPEFADLHSTIVSIAIKV